LGGKYADLPDTIKSVKDARETCAKIGLEVIEIDPDKMQNLIMYMVQQEFPVNDIGVVPLGYDYGCEKAGCNKEFNSINKVMSE